jgi:hypothetical protein
MRRSARTMLLTAPEFLLAGGFWIGDSFGIRLPTSRTVYTPAADL